MRYSRVCEPRLRSGLLVFVVIVVSCAWSYAQIPVTDDAFTSSATPGSNYGVSLGLVVQSPSASGLMTSPFEAGGFKANTYLKFDLGALPPNVTAASLAKANLRLYVDFVVCPGKFDVYLVATPWAESTLTANNAPGIVGAPIATGVQITSALKYIDIDITSAFAAGPPANGFVLVPSPGSNIFASFDSKENPLTSHDPELSITLNNASSSQLQQEITRATQAENIIATNVSHEVVRAQGAETALGNSLNSEIANRIAGDAAGKAYTDASVGAEAVARAGADNALQGNLNALQNSLAGYAQLSAANQFTMNQTINADLTTQNLNASGEVTAGGGAQLPPTGLATPLQAFPSSPFDLAASVSDGTNSHNETFRWQSIPVNNGGPNFAAQLSLQYGGGVGPSPTGFSFNSDGTINFALGQKFAGDGSGLAHISANFANNANTANTANTAASANNALALGGVAASAFAQSALANNFTASQTITGNLNIAGAGNGITFPDGSTLTSAIASGSGGGVANSSSVLPAFLPGPLTAPYTAASFVPDIPISITRISAALKTPPDTNCAPAVLRITDGNGGQDLNLLAGLSVRDTGTMLLKIAAGAHVSVNVQRPANCGQNPADANVIVEYRAQRDTDTSLCAGSGTLCNGICEDSQTDPDNCGSCGHVCGASNGTAGCVGGACSILGCAPYFADCNASAADGCETDVRTSAANCGSCGNNCNVPNSVGQCRYVAAHCAAFTSDGSCPFGEAVPDSFTCSFTCNTGFGDCDQNASNGCETDLTNDPNNCGTCGNKCAGACVNGACASCPTGTTACNGACVRTTSNPNDCGSCGNVCPHVPGCCNIINGGAIDCNSGTCQFGGCVSCDLGQQACVNSTCGGSCPASTTLCSGECVDTTSDPSNCGTCGNQCPSQIRECCDSSGLCHVCQAPPVCVRGTCL